MGGDGASGSGVEVSAEASVPEEKAIAICIVSDLHAGPDTSFPELGATAERTVSAKAFGLERLAKAMAAEIAAIPPPRRILACPGDLTSSCATAELELAGRFLTELAQRLEIPDGHRLLVPGNHDIDRSLTKLSQTTNDPWYGQQRQRKAEDVLKRVAPTFQIPFRGEPLWVPCVDGHLAFVLLDSPFNDTHDRSPHCGELGERQLQRLTTILESAPPGVPIGLLLHHHVTPWRRSIDQPDFSILNDARGLIDALAGSLVSFVVHGHQHRPGIDRLSTGDGRDVTIVGAGTTTAWVARRPEDAPCTFHVVVIDDPAQDPPRGYVSTRALSALSGWGIPNHPQIRGRHPFGPMPTAERQNELAALAIARCRQERLVKLPAFLAEHPDSQYWPDHFFAQALRNYLARTTTKVEVARDSERDAWQLQSLEPAE